MNTNHEFKILIIAIDYSLTSAPVSTHTPTRQDNPISNFSPAPSHQHKFHHIHFPLLSTHDPPIPYDMVVTVLNASTSETSTQALLSHHLTAFADVDVIAGQKHYPAHRAVLAVHSLDFRDVFSKNASSAAPPAGSTSPDLLSGSLPTATHTTNPPPTTLPVSSDPAPSGHVHVSPSSPIASPDPFTQQLAEPRPTGLAIPDTDRYRVHIALDHVDDVSLRAGWSLVYAYIYGARVQLDTEAVLAALPICRRYRFETLARVLDAFLCEGAVSALNCTRVYATAVVGMSNREKRRDREKERERDRDRERNSDAEVVQVAAWAVMKSEFSHVSGWDIIPYGALVRLLKLNDLSVTSEMAVFHAVVQWVEGNRDSADDDVVAGLVKLVRFPTMTMEELEQCAASNLVKTFPVCRKYVSRGLAARADERRGLVRNVVMESSPIYRRRRTDALTFSDRVTNWRRVDKSVHTSSRYFAGCLWNLIVEVPSQTQPSGWIGLYLGCLSESEDHDVDVELDFSVFIVRHTGTHEPDLVRKQVKGGRFSRSGQRIGFPNMIQRSEIDADGARFLLHDTLFIGASIRLRSSNLPVIGITQDGDDSAQSQSSMI